LANTSVAATAALGDEQWSNERVAKNNIFSKHVPLASKILDSEDIICSYFFKCPFLLSRLEQEVPITIYVYFISLECERCWSATSGVKIIFDREQIATRNFFMSFVITIILYLL
jgi:hypothetical protein